MTLFERLTKAQEHPQRLILPESLEPRTLQAANKVIEAGIADITFIGEKKQYWPKPSNWVFPILKARIVSASDTSFTEPYAVPASGIAQEKRHVHRGSPRDGA